MSLQSQRTRIFFGVLFILFMLVVLQQLQQDMHISKGDTRFIARYVSDAHRKKIYAITPTFARHLQIAELTRISHVVKLCPHIHWIIVEDSPFATRLVRELVQSSGLAYRTTILHVATSEDNYLQKFQLKSKGVRQRNLGLQWVRANVQNPQAIVYFMDDDNAYSVELFSEMTKIDTGRVGVWPVAFVGGTEVERPLVDPRTKTVVGFNALFEPSRKFAIDMSGFAVSLDLLTAYPEVYFESDLPVGHLESTFLSNITAVDLLQPLANLCRDVLVWHTKTELPNILINRIQFRTTESLRGST